MDYINDLHEICETLSKELGEANKKIMQGGGKLSGADLDYVDKLTHAIKSVKTTIAMMEAEENGYSGDDYSGRMYPTYGRSYADNDMRTDGRSYNDGRSYAERRNARRDSMGRYSGRGYSRDSEMISELHDLMQDAPDEKTKQEFKRFIDRLENMA